MFQYIIYIVGIKVNYRLRNVYYTLALSSTWRRDEFGTGLINHLLRNINYLGRRRPIEITRYSLYIGLMKPNETSIYNSAV